MSLLSYHLPSFTFQSSLVLLHERHKLCSALAKHPSSFVFQLSLAACTLSPLYTRRLSPFTIYSTMRKAAVTSAGAALDTDRRLYSVAYFTFIKDTYDENVNMCRKMNENKINMAVKYLPSCSTCATDFYEHVSVLRGAQGPLSALCFIWARLEIRIRGITCDCSCIHRHSVTHISGSSALPFNAANAALID